MMKQRVTLKSRIKKYIKQILHFFPIQKKKIVFVNFDGRGYGDNLKYIAEEIRRQKLPWKMVWLVRGEADVPNNIKTVNMDALAAYYELSTAEILISNSKKNIPVEFFTGKKKKQYYLQTWHGDFALKYIEKEIEDSFSQGYVARSKVDSAATNAILSGNMQFTKILKESFWLPSRCEILEYGVPRNDIYFKSEEYRNRLKLQYGFSVRDRILLYAPTFRDDLDISCYDIDFEHLKSVMSQSGDEAWKIIVRMHPNVPSKEDMFDFNDHILNGSIFPDSQELCMISDCLITDYSSIMGDFLLMKKPVFLYVPDLAKYSDKSAGRGLRELYYHLPFPLSRNQSELESNITGFEKTEYVDRVNGFMLEYYNTFDDGHASERVVNHLKSV